MIKDNISRAKVLSIFKDIAEKRFKSKKISKKNKIDKKNIKIKEQKNKRKTPRKELKKNIKILK